jgi:hypothetical protein
VLLVRVYYKDDQHIGHFHWHEMCLTLRATVPSFVTEDTEEPESRVLFVEKTKVAKDDWLETDILIEIRTTVTAQSRVAEKMELLAKNIRSAMTQLRQDIPITIAVVVFESFGFVHSDIYPRI